MTSDNQTNRVILIVEDEDELCYAIKSALLSISDTVLTAANGAEAMSLLNKHSDTCAILSDVKMPVLDGLQLLGAIRSQFNPIPFVILTGHGDSSNYQEAIRLNATDFLEKPFKRDELLRVMEKAITYGVDLIEAERRLNKLLSTSGLSPDKLSEVKRVKQAIMSMRSQHSIYVKNTS